MGTKRESGGVLICRTITAAGSWLPTNKCYARPHSSVLHHSGEDHHILGEERSLYSQLAWNRQKETESLKWRK